MSPRRRLALGAIAAAAVFVLAACPDKKESARPGPTTTTASTLPERPRGGVVRVGVLGMPDPAAPTLTGAAVRALVLPQLWVADQGGGWQPSLVQPGSDRLAADGRSASFVLRRGAAWSNGAAIGVEDLRRSADVRFVDGVDGPDAEGRIAVRFKQKLPGWQRLWSGTDVVAAPGPGVWGGPFVVGSVTPGLEVVLRRNPSWWNAPQPYVDEVRLVQVLDTVLLRQLFDRGELDVVAPPAYTVRSEQYGSARAHAGEGGGSGWDVRLVLNPAKLDEPTRRGVVGAVDRRLFVDTLLKDEASVLHGWAGGQDLTWSTVLATATDTTGLKGKTVQLTGSVEEPMTNTLQRAVQKRVGGAGGVLEFRAAELDRVDGWVVAGDYEAAVVMAYDGPSVCWTCRWSTVDAALATAADSGDEAAARALEEKLRDTRLVLPLWRPTPMAAAAPRVRGVVPNGYALSAAWNAWEWYVEPA